MTRLLLLVALPAFTVALVSLRRRQAVEVGPIEDPPDPGRAHGDVVVPLEIHRNLLGPKVVVLPEVDDLAYHLGLGRVGANQGPTRPFTKAFWPELLIPTQPVVERMP